MSELSRRMMVTGGNVTGITDQLVDEGLVERATSPATGAPGRAPDGARAQASFDAMAAAARALDRRCLRGARRAKEIAQLAQAARQGQAAHRSSVDGGTT